MKKHFLFYLAGFLFITLFFRACYLQTKEKRLFFNGVATKKYKGSKGSLVVIGYSKSKGQNVKFVFSPTENAINNIFENDSMSKKENSFFVYFYTNQTFKDSFELYHY